MSHAVFAAPAPEKLHPTQLAAIDRLLLAALKDGPHAVRRAIKRIIETFPQWTRGNCWRRLRQLRRRPEFAVPAVPANSGAAAPPAAPANPRPIRRPPARGWSAAEKGQLLSCTGYEPVKKIAQRLGRSEAALRFRLGALGVSARVKDGHSLGALRELLRVSPKRLRFLIGTGLLRVRDGRISAASFAAYFERQRASLDTAAVERFAAAQKTKADGYSWKRAAAILGVGIERIHELLCAGVLKVVDPFVTERQFGEFCKKHGSQINLALLPPQTVRWLQGYGLKPPVDGERTLSKAQKHTLQLHQCRCGKEIAGNAYFKHIKACKIANSKARGAAA
jgi:hypothetical protein